MNVLLDTHVLLWAMAAPDKLAKESRAVLESPANTIFVSAVSAWEIEVKRSLGKVKAPTNLADRLLALRFSELPVHVRHVRELAALPDLHRDPFDRMLIAQSKADGFVLMTRDDRIRQYPVRTMAA